MAFNYRRFFCIGIFLFLNLNALFAQDELVLNPVEISGSIQLGTDDLAPDTQINYIKLNIIANGGSASKAIIPNPQTNLVTYSVFVDVPVGGSADVSVYPVLVYRENYAEYSTFNPKTITVTDAQPVTDLNFSIENPGTLSSKVTINNGVLVNGYIDIRPDTGQTTSSYVANYTRVSLTSGITDYTVAMEPGIYKIAGRASLENGSSVDFSGNTIEIFADQTTPFDVTLEAPLTGSVNGTITYSGPKQVQSYTVYLYGSKTTKILDIPFTEMPEENTATYSFDGVAVGSANIFVKANLADNDSPANKTVDLPAASFESIYTPTYTATVVADEVATVNVNSQQASITGDISFSGAVDYTDLSSSYHQIRYNLPQNRGASFAYDYLTPTKTLWGSYEVIAAQGQWYLDFLNYAFNNNDADPAAYYDVRVLDYPRNTSDYSVVVPQNGHVVKDVNIPIGSAKINARIIGGKLFTNPLISAACVQKNNADVIIKSSTITAYSTNQVDVTEGVINFLAPTGTCTLDVFATVEGGQTLIASDITIDMISGVDQEIDIGAPTLTLTTPGPDTVTESKAITVTGTSVDDVEVASVSVNDIQAVLIPDVEGDLSSVSFSVSGLTLLEGDNVIITSTTDTSGNTAKETRILTYKPVILNTAPVVNDMQVSVDENSRVSFELSTIDAENDVLTLNIITSPAHGVLSKTINNTYSYTPDAGYFGLDSFSFSANDGLLNSEIATVYISVMQQGSGGVDTCSEPSKEGSINDSNACSLEQMCPCSGPVNTTGAWRNHGKYVSCVSKTAKSFIGLGLILPTEHGGIVAEAARSSCGMPVK